ncbi:MAG TPA: tetratricopeptide repeat protein [bacterium]|nr:tetratricopeptide repeat protein [bacterium]
MSLILDALKKTESSKENSENNDQPSPTLEGSASGTFTMETLSSSASSAVTLLQSGRNKLIILIAAGILGLSLIIYLAISRGLSELFSFGQKEEVQIVQTPIQTTTPEPLQEDPARKEQEIIQLKKEAIANFRSAKYLESVEIYKKLVNLLPASPEIYNNYALSLKKAGKITEAKQTYQIALALNEDYPEGLNNLAAIEISEQKYNEARKHLERAVELSPEYMDAHLHLAICLEKIGDVQKAVLHYQQFLDLSEGKSDRETRLQIENRLSSLTDELVVNSGDGNER